MTEMDSDIKMNTNPSYNITKKSSEQEDQYDYTLHDKLALHDDPSRTMKMDTNLSYGRIKAGL